MRCVTLGDAIRSWLPCFGAIYLLLLHTIEVQSVVQNVTRGKKDTFLNPDKKCDSNSCYKYRNIPVEGSSTKGYCGCSCGYDYTFVVHNTTCVDNNNLHLILRRSLPGKDASFYVTKSNSCPSIYTVSSIPTLDITRPSDCTLCLIDSETVITDCKIIKKDSFYYYQGKWYPIWPPNKQQNTFNITDGFGNSVLQWKPLGKQFAGLIFGLRISCDVLDSSDDDETVKSYLIFKSAGSHYFNGVKPTLAPSGDNVPSSPSTTQPSTTASKSDKNGLIAGLVIVAILVILVIVGVVVFFLRRKRNNEEASTGAKCEANPTYEMGQDKSLPVRVSGQTPTYDSPDTSSRYQPLVQNTRMRDASGKVPVYTPLNRQTGDDQQPVVQMKTPNKSLAYESVAIPIQHPAVDSPAGVEESPDYEDPANPTIPKEGGLYAVVSDQDGNTIDFQNAGYVDPDSILPCN